MKKKHLYRRARDSLITFTAMYILVCMDLAFADNGSSMYITLISVVTKIFIGIGAFLAATGLEHYAMANGDGDGPSKRKATMEIASGVVLVLTAILVDASKEAWAAIIAT